MTKAQVEQRAKVYDSELGFNLPLVQRLAQTMLDLNAALEQIVASFDEPGDAATIANKMIDIARAAALPTSKEVSDD